MSRLFLLLILASVCLFGEAGAAPGDDGPPISITSPDTASTFAYGSVKSHSLAWNQSKKMLIAYITFTDADQNFGQPNDDSHEFRIPGITFDQAKGVFFATTAKGVAIPVAHIKKTLFLKTIETTANANVRVIHPRGNVTVILEAISPNDPAMHPAPDDPDGNHKVDIDKVLN